MKKLLLEFSSLAFIIVFVAGCGASSGTLRYKAKDTETSGTMDSNIRFASEQKVVQSPDSSLTDESSLNYGLDEDEEDDLPENEPAIDLTEVMAKFNSNSAGNDAASGFTSERERILMEIIKYLDTPYKYGGNSKNGIDCSAFTQTIYNNTLDIPLLRSAREQYTMGIVIENKDELAFGDLVFFNTRRRVKPGHVGIYIGDNLFAHASSKHGVIVSSLDHDYYSKRYMGGRRIEGTFSPGM